MESYWQKSVSVTLMLYKRGGEEGGLFPLPLLFNKDFLPKIVIRYAKHMLQKKFKNAVSIAMVIYEINCFYKNQGSFQPE